MPDHDPERALTLADFTPALGDRFDAVPDEGAPPMTLTLTAADPLPAGGYPGAARAPFALAFRGDGAVVLPQRIHRLRHAAMGEMAMFLVPIARDAAGVTYEAVFN